MIHAKTLAVLICLMVFCRLIVFLGPSSDYSGLYEEWWVKFVKYCGTGEVLLQIVLVFYSIIILIAL